VISHPLRSLWAFTIRRPGVPLASTTKESSCIEAMSVAVTPIEVRI
jgi:hypothetical protein